MNLPHPIRAHVRAIAYAQICAVALIAAAQCASGIEPSNIPRQHKVQVSGASAEAAIVAQGGRLVADYGAYRLYSLAQPVTSLLKESGVESRADYDEIQLNTGTLDTRDASVKALNAGIGDFTGRRLHLVQFVGPVQPAWQEALVS